MQRDDAPTVAAIAILAGCVATVLHEAIGHGAVCLAHGGEITRLTSVYFGCSARTLWIDAGGPIGNLAGTALGAVALRLIPAAWARARLFAALLLAFSLFWLAGYLIYAAVLGEGDPWGVMLGLFGEPGLTGRGVMIGVGLVLYSIGIALIRRTREPRSRLRLAWLAAGLAAFAAALAYAPDRLASAIQGGLQIGGASIALLLPAAGPATEPEPIARSWPWIGVAAVGFALFVATLGRGLP